MPASRHCRNRWSALGRAPVLASLLCLAVAGCAAVDRSVALVEYAVVPFTAGESGRVAPEDLAEAMLRAGFTPEQIIDHGPAIASALASSGAAQVRSGDVIEALFTIYANALYVTSRTRGTFLEPLDGAISPGAAIVS